MLVSLVYGIVRIGQRSAGAIDDQVDQTEGMRIGWEFLHRALTQARPLPNPEDPQDTTSFSGGANFLSFVADMPSYIGMGGLMRISLDIDDTTDGSRLIVSRERFDRRGEAPPEDASDSAVLVEDLESLEATLELLSDPDALARLAQAERDLERAVAEAKESARPSGESSRGRAAPPRDPNLVAAERKLAVRPTCDSSTAARSSPTRNARPFTPWPSAASTGTVGSCCPGVPAASAVLPAPCW